MSIVKTDLEDIIVVVGHPHQDIPVPLSEWIRVGPGPRPLVRPISAYSSSTGKPFPMSVVPIRFRNNVWSRILIKTGLFDDPWIKS